MLSRARLLRTETRWWGKDGIAYPAVLLLLRRSRNSSCIFGRNVGSEGKAGLAPAAAARIALSPGHAQSAVGGCVARDRAAGRFAAPLSVSQRKYEAQEWTSQPDDNGSNPETRLICVQSVGTTLGSRPGATIQRPMKSALRVAFSLATMTPPEGIAKLGRPCTTNGGQDGSRRDALGQRLFATTAGMGPGDAVDPRGAISVVRARDSLSR